MKAYTVIVRWDGFDILPYIEIMPSGNLINLGEPIGDGPHPLLAGGAAGPRIYQSYTRGGCQVPRRVKAVDVHQPILGERVELIAPTQRTKGMAAVLVQMEKKAAPSWDSVCMSLITGGTRAIPLVSSKRAGEWFYNFLLIFYQEEEQYLPVLTQGGWTTSLHIAWTGGRMEGW